MREMIEENETPVLGLQLGEKNHRYFTVDDLKHRIQTLCLEIEQAAFEKKSIHLQVGAAKFLVYCIYNTLRLFMCFLIMDAMANGLMLLELCI